MLNKLFEMLVTSVMNLFSSNELDSKFWVFSSSYNRKFNYNARYMFDYVFEYLQLEHDIKPVFVINDDVLRERLNDQYRTRYKTLFGHDAPRDFFVAAHSWADKRELLRAGVWFTSAGLPVYQGLRNRNRLVINLWHGVPLKKIALSEENAGLIHKLFFRLVFSRNYTHVVTNSAPLIPIMSESFAVPEERVVIWGQPRNDVLLHSISTNQSFSLQEVFSAHNRPLPNYKFAVLYAPTYRDTEATQLFPFPDFDIEVLDSFLKAHGIVILLRCHQSEQATLSHSSSHILEFGSDLQADVNEALPAFDALVTDYSSIYIDYLLLDRPMLFLPYDKDAYLATRGLNFEYDAVTPGPKPGSLGEFMAELGAFTALKTACETTSTDSKELKDDFAAQRKQVNQLLNGAAQLSCPLIAHEILNKFTKQGGTLTTPLRGKPSV